MPQFGPTSAVGGLPARHICFKTTSSGFSWYLWILSLLYSPDIFFSLKISTWICFPIYLLFVRQIFNISSARNWLDPDNRNKQYIRQTSSLLWFTLMMAYGLKKKKEQRNMILPDSNKYYKEKKPQNNAMGWKVREATLSGSDRLLWK